MAAANGNNRRCAGLTALLQENKPRCDSGGGDTETHGLFFTGYLQLSSEFVARIERGFITPERPLTNEKQPRSQDPSNADGKPNELLKKTFRSGSLVLPFGAYASNRSKVEKKEMLPEFRKQVGLGNKRRTTENLKQMT